MAWTPHTSAEIAAAGGSPMDDWRATGKTINQPVVIGPNQYGVTDTSNPVPFSYSSSQSSAKTADYSSILGDLKTSLGSVGESLNAAISNMSKQLSGAMSNQITSQDLQKLIMQNTDKNNAWSAAQAQRQMDFQERMQGISQDFNASEAAKNRNWQEMMSNTAHQREVADLKAAGLNPVLSASGGNGASMGSGSAASVGMQSGAQGNPDQSGNSALVAIYSALINAQTQMENANLSARTNLQMAEMSKQAQIYGAALAAEASMKNAQIGADASRYSADVSRDNAMTNAEASRYVAGSNYAASQYAADMNYKNNQEQREWNAAHPSNAYQAGASIIGKANSSTPTGKSLISGDSGVHVFDDLVNGIKNMFGK